MAQAWILHLGPVKGASLDLSLSTRSQLKGASLDSEVGLGIRAQAWTLALVREAR
jgi:hypothetical protein